MLNHKGVKCNLPYYLIGCLGYIPSLLNEEIDNTLEKATTTLVGHGFR